MISFEFLSIEWLPNVNKFFLFPLRFFPTSEFPTTCSLNNNKYMQKLTKLKLKCTKIIQSLKKVA